MTRLLLGILFVVKLCIFVGEVTIYIITSPFVALNYTYHYLKNHLFRHLRYQAISRFSRHHFLFTPFVWYVLLKGGNNCFKEIYRSIHTSIKRISGMVYSAEFRFFLAGFCICFIMIACLNGYRYLQSLPSPRLLGKTNFAQSSHMYDRHGKVLFEIYRDVNRTPIPLRQIPDDLIKATLAIEDKHFYQHRGVSFFGGILRALKETVRTNQLQGGSTITQQLVKSALLGPERTIDRKTKEIILALWAEQIYSKDQILEMYFNQVPYGGSAYGVEEAARIYFGRRAKDLTVSQAALLAGLPKAPSIYSPFINADLALKRRNEVLAQMYEEGYLSRAQYTLAKQSPLGVIPLKNIIKAPHFVFYTKELLEEEYGTHRIEEGGLQVNTSLDLEIQHEAERIMQEEIEKIRALRVSNGGMIVLQPSTGEILAMVGSVDYFKSPNGAFNVTTARRQPGSTLKPALYALALQRGYTAATMIDDSPIIFQSAGETYQPVNYDGRYHGRVPLRYALANSYNIPAIKVLNTLGVSSFITFAQDLGIGSWEDTSRFGLSIGLGGGEVTLLDLARMYSVFANAGYQVEITPIHSIVDNHGEIVEEVGTRKTRLLDERIAFIISDILSDNVARQMAFGPASSLEIPGYQVAVKTGTSNDKHDNLTIGYTPDYLVAVWVGNNDNTPMDPQLTSGITGAAPIWHRMMAYLLERNEVNTPFIRPEGLIVKPCYREGSYEYFLPGTEAVPGCFDSTIKARPENSADTRTY